MFSRFYQHITQQNYFKTNDTLLIAVSGGIDSMVLLHLFQQTSFNISVAYFDHLTRAGQSSQDLKFVEEYCKTYNLNFYSKCMNKHKEIKNFHNEAHEQRYAFFNSLNHSKIVTGHHHDDVAESIFLNFIRGKSLNGIPSENRTIIRPLVTFSKSEIEKYASKNNVKYINDASNKESIYDRNFVRNKAFPLLSKHFDKIDHKIINLSNRISEREKAFSALSKKFLQPIDHLNYTSINKVLLLDLKKSGPQVLHQYLITFGFSLTQSENIISGLQKTGNTFKSLTHYVVIDRTDIRIYVSIEKPSSITLQVPAEELEVEFSNYKIVIEANKHYTLTSSQNEAYFDLASIGSTITIRHWEEGDRFYPLNMGGKQQRLKKYFTDQKLDRFEKDQVPIFMCENNDIFWVGGFRMDDRYKVTEKTRSIIKISLLTK